MGLIHGVAIGLILLAASFFVGLFCLFVLGLPAFQSGTITLILWLPFISTISDAIGAPNDE